MLSKQLRTSVLLNLKNTVGWRTSRKIVVISVDDYGNVRLHSGKARERMNKEGLRVHNRFDALDTLETREDLEALYDTLSEVKDQNGRNAVITAFALPCNINFEKMAETGYRKYHYEILPQTYQKLAGLDPFHYEGAWNLWKEGMKNELIVPQFHGREHLNVKVFEEKLRSNDHELLTALKNRSFTSISNSGYETVSPMAAFDFWNFEENEDFHNVVEDGLSQFENVFGVRADNFTPPVFNAHPVLYNTLKRNGIRSVDTAIFVNEHQGEGRYKRRINYTGKKTESGITLMVRNVVFEPTSNLDVHWPSYALKQIEAAFRWNRPAIISSHRVNFCGYISPGNRKKGLQSLKELLKEIIQRWPDVEFMTANELCRLIASENRETKN